MRAAFTCMATLLLASCDMPAAEPQAVLDRGM